MNCEYQAECPYTNNCFEDCFLKELLNDFHNLEEKYFKLNKENEELKKKKDEYYLRTLDYETKISYLIQALEEIRSYCDEQNLKADYTACYITNRIDEVLNDRD